MGIAARCLASLRRSAAVEGLLSHSGWQRMSLSYSVGYATPKVDPYAVDPVKELTRVLLGHVKNIQSNTKTFFDTLDDSRKGPRSEADVLPFATAEESNAVAAQRDVRGFEHALDYVFRVANHVVNMTPSLGTELTRITASLAKRCIAVHQSQATLRMR